jgi:large subunit ribosomal protein L6
MSRIGKLPISIPSDVTVTIQGQKVTVKGKKGELHLIVHPEITVAVEEQSIVVKNSKETKQNNALHGTTRALLNNMVNGVTKGYEKRLEVRGVGYRFTIAGKKLNLALGYSHPVEFMIPAGITITVDEENKNLMIISGFDRQLVGETAARIREFRKPEPYKGKGIRYVDEHVTIKQGKKAAK